MEKFESVVRIEPKVFYEKIRQFESTRDFACFIQNGNSLDELFLNIQEKQRKLIYLMCDCVICLSFLLLEETNRKDFLVPPCDIDISHIKDIPQIIELMKENKIISSKLFETQRDLLTFVNEKCCKYFKIFENGHKSKERSLEKIRVKLENNPSFLNDTIRLTISPLYPEYIELINKYLSETNNIFFQSKHWTISPSGILHNNCYVNIDGNIGQIAIDERLQRETNFQCSHEIYTVMRLMEGDNFQFNISCIDETTLKKIMDGYNYIMKKYGLQTDTKFSPIEDIALFQPQKLQKRYEELLLLHQNIHIDAICRANDEWQKLYCNLIIETNRKSELLSRRKIFPEEFLQKIPQYKVLQESKFHKGETLCGQL